MKRLTVKQIVYGTLRHAHRQLERDRRTHFGLASHGRNVVTEWPDDLIAPAADEDHANRERQRGIVEGQLREVLRRPEWVQLVARHLFERERIAALARAFGVKPGTAASAVRRAKRYLGLLEPPPNTSHGSGSAAEVRSLDQTAVVVGLQKNRSADETNSNCSCAGE